MRRSHDRITGSRSLLAMRYLGFLLPLLGAALWGWWSFQVDVQHARVLTFDKAVLVQRYADRLIQTQTTLHAAAQERARVEDADFLRSDAYQIFLARIEASQQFTLGLAVVAFDGAFVASSRSATPIAPLNDPAYIKAIMAGERVHVDRIRVEPSGIDALVVVTPFDVNGFSGALISAVRIEAVRDFLQDIAARPGESASLLREDGMLLVRSTPSTPIMLDPDSPARRAVADGDTGSYDTVAVSDGVRRLYAFTRLTELGMYAHFGTPHSAIVQGWLSRAAPIWALLAAMSLLTFAIANQMRRSTEAKIAAEIAAERVSEAENLAAQRTKLVQEMNHRVKNNLSLIVSLIGMQMHARGFVDGGDLQARIHAVSQVHDLMYQAKDGIHADFGEIVTQISRSPAMVPHESRITVHCDAASGILLGPELSTPLAIITAELITNAVKHAFRGRDGGTIWVSLDEDGDHAVLEVRDDGVGLPAQADRNSGMAIIDAFVDQVGAELVHLDTQGAGFRIRFPVQPSDA